MIVIAIILLLLSIGKILLVFIDDNIRENIKIESIDPLYKIAILILAIDGVIGVMCGLFILLW